MEKIIKTKKVEIEISIQAQRILAESKHSIDELIEWALKEHKFGLGGTEAAIFLEFAYTHGDKK